MSLTVQQAKDISTILLADRMGMPGIEISCNAVKKIGECYVCSAGSIQMHLYFLGYRHIELQGKRSEVGHLGFRADKPAKTEIIDEQTENLKLMNQQISHLENYEPVTRFITRNVSDVDIGTKNRAIVAWYVTAK